MKTKIITKVKEGSNRVLMAITALVAMLAFVPSSVVLAWGPERTTYTMEKPSDHVTFNSITDNASIGDERNFVRVREANTENHYVDNLEIAPGKEYEVYIAYHNNAAENLNKSENGGKGIALGAKVSTQFPTEVTPEKQGVITATITAENADPKSVWDEAFVTTKSNSVLLRYKPASAKIHNQWDTNGKVLPQNLFEETGTYLGMNKLDGVLNGCFQFSGYITYTLIAENAEARVDKTVSVDGETFYENVEAKPGDIVTFKVDFRNGGTKDLTNVGFRDTFPDGLELVEGTTIIYDNAHANGEKLTDLINKNGYNLGKYGQGTYATIYYKAKVRDDAVCSKGLVNNILVSHDNGEVSDGATVNVKCEEGATGGENPSSGTTGSEGTTPGSLPNTGPGEVALALIILAVIGVLGVYWGRSYVAVKKAGK
ncbi:isopeptide-forming domain-containing fimbrial protein [Candidatus Saccharibacteria bacterium]|nr:isopeptide-forming domain-containing fimbrial protein [Candidatus Saccharibacteria bacterium]